MSTEFWEVQLELTKGGKITLKGVSFDIRTEQDQQVRGLKIMNN